MKQKLIEILYKQSFKYDPDFGFTLASGKKSDIYVDVKKTVLSANGIELTGRAIFNIIKDKKVDGIGGLTLGADPLAYSAAMVSNQEGAPLNVFIVRKEAKKHGTQRWIEGVLSEGARVIVVDDVVTTGGSTIQAIEKAKEAGFEVVAALALVDREEGGYEAVSEHCPFESVVTRTELLSYGETLK
ncbi:MAG: orotate phosphoribosyltransferase [Deltaproteobacteria bacterium]|nr:orotate phosphoribosyltransferase [Deltaproteobacteria bacterium]